MTIEIPWEIEKMEFDTGPFSGEILRSSLVKTLKYSFAVRDHRDTGEDLTKTVYTGREKNLDAAKLLIEHWITKRLEAFP